MKYGQALVEDFRASNWGITFLMHLMNYFPWLEDKIPLWPAAFDRVWDITKSLIKQREEKDIKANDFLNRLIELQKTIGADPSGDLAKNLSDDMLVAQGVIFFLAGYETTTNTLSTLSYNLAKNPQVQERLYDEVQEALEAHNGRLDHETIGDLTYLEAAINENLRRNGPVTMHFRLCSKDTEVCHACLYYVAVCRT